MLPNLSALRLSQPPRCRGCGPSVGKYYADRGLALDSTDIKKERKTGEDWMLDATCVICMEPLAGPAGGEAALTEALEALEALIENESLKTCNHMFHSACLAKWIDKGKDTCPTCRAPIDQLVLDRYNEGYAVYYGGPKVRVEKRDGSVVYYEGEKQGQERKVRVTFPRGGMAVQNYDGKRGQEHLVSGVARDKSKTRYEGKPGKESLVELVTADGTIHEYKGEYGKERVVRTTTANGDVYEFLGEQGGERMVRFIQESDGKTFEYEGEKGEERIVSMTTVDRDVYEYLGQKGEERIVRSTRKADGATFEYEGEKGKEVVLSPGSKKETPPSEDA